jgi:uncharacterized protein
MIPLTFGSADRPLFGVHHPAQTPTAKPRGVLLCNPWGQEAIRAHRLLRVLADRLSRSGLHVLRFDYFGTGDSAGNDEDGDLKGWAGDIVQAHQTLQAQSRAQGVAALTKSPLGAPEAKTQDGEKIGITWIGVRLGALLALQAASIAPTQSADQLLLWDPVLSGPNYLDLLATKHAQALQEVYSLPPFLFKQDPRQAPSGPIQEALGFGIGTALREQLMQVNPESILAQHLRPSTHIVTHDKDLGQQLKHVQPEHSIQHVAHDFDWTAEEAMNTALVPANAIQCLVSCVLERT